MNPLLIPPPIADLLERRRRRCALLLTLLVGVLVGLCIAFGVLSVRELLEKLAEKSLEIAATAALVGLGVSR